MEHLIADFKNPKCMGFFSFLKQYKVYLALILPPKERNKNKNTQSTNSPIFLFEICFKFPTKLKSPRNSQTIDTRNYTRQSSLSLTELTQFQQQQWHRSTRIRSPIQLTHLPHTSPSLSTSTSLPPSSTPQPSSPSPLRAPALSPSTRAPSLSTKYSTPKP